MAVLPLYLPVKRRTLQARKKGRIHGLEEITSSLKVLCANACFLITFVKPAPATPHRAIHLQSKKNCSLFYTNPGTASPLMRNWRNSCQFILASMEKTPELPRFGFAYDLKFTELLVLNKLHVWDEILNSHWSEIEFFHWHWKGQGFNPSFWDRS